MAKKAKAKKAVAKLVIKRAVKKSKPKRKPREKTVAEKDKHDDKRDNKIENRDQDPNHPANKTLSPKIDPAPRPVAEGITVAPEEMLTEQEKDAAGGGENAGVGPVTPSAVTTGPVETIEDQGIGPRTPYPTGNPPPPDESTTLSQGIWKGDEAEARDTPNERKTVKRP
jgi:hypothetical protein